MLDRAAQPTQHQGLDGRFLRPDGGLFGIDCPALGTPEACRPGWPSAPMNGRSALPTRDALPQRQAWSGLIQGVEVQTRDALSHQPRTEIGHHLVAKSLERSGVIGERSQAQPDPARNLRTAGIGKARELCVIGDRHDARNDGHTHTPGLRCIDEAKVGVGVIEILGDGRVCTGLDLGDEGIQIGLG